MNKWAYFSMGIMSGIIAVLAVLLLSQHHENLAYANPMREMQAPGMQMMIETGGTQNNLEDLIWVVYRRERSLDSEDAGSRYQTSIAGYKIGQGNAKMELICVRDITWDLEIPDYQTKPAVKGIKAQVEKAAKKKEKEKEKK